MRKNCAICGKPSGMYPLCSDCFKLRDEGKISKCDKCGKWHFVDQPCDCIEINNFTICNDNINKTVNAENIKTNENIDGNKTLIYPKQNCIFCNNEVDPDNGGWQYLCSDCYPQVLNYKNSIDKDMTKIQFRDYYYNLKLNIMRMQGFNEFIIPNCKKLIAIAKIASYMVYDDTLINKVKDDVLDIIEKKKNKDFIREEAKIIEMNINRTKEPNKAQDGHFLDSQKEITIDDILFNNQIAHAIHYAIPEITERTVVCDWYIPITAEKGIIIEYWGMDKKDYIKNKEEKKALYKNHEDTLKLIEFEKDDLQDTSYIKRHLIGEYRKLKKEIFDSSR